MCTDETLNDRLLIHVYANSMYRHLFLINNYCLFVYLFIIGRFIHSFFYITMLPRVLEVPGSIPGRVQWFIACIFTVVALKGCCCEKSGVTAGELNLQSLVSLSVAGCGWLQLWSSHCHTSVALLQVVGNWPHKLHVVVYSKLCGSWPNRRLTISYFVVHKFCINLILSNERISKQLIFSFPYIWCLYAIFQIFPQTIKCQHLYNNASCSGTRTIKDDV